MKTKLLPIFLAMGSLTASTYYITVDKQFKPFYQVPTSKWENSTSIFTEWVDINVPFDYTQFLPEIANQSSDFQQSRSHKQNQERYEQKREYDSIKDIYKDVGDPIRHEQTINRVESRTVNVVTLADWSDVGIPSNCTAWSPSTDTVQYGDEFTQTRQCDQERTRTLEYYIDSNLEHSNTENTFFPINENQQNFGTNASSGWVSTTPTFTEWNNIGEGYDKLGWTPEINNQIIDFQQSQDYSQDQQQFEQAREQNTFTNEYRDVGDPIEHNQTITETETRNVVVELDVWVDSGALYNCSEWTPSANTIEYGQQFTQQRDCSQDQTANISYKVESVEISTGTTNQTITETENQQATGTDTSGGWVSIASTFTNWADVSTKYNYGTWSPAISNQRTDFTQNADYDIDQERHEQQREQNSYTNEIRNVGTPIKHEQTLRLNENRTITVTLGNWSNVNALHSCDSWTPDVSEVQEGTIFTQTRNCLQEQQRDVTFSHSGNQITTQQDSQNISIVDTQQAVGTKTNKECHPASYPVYFMMKDTGHDIPKQHIYWNGTFLGAYSQQDLNIDPYTFETGITVSGYVYWHDVFYTGNICRQPTN